MLPAGSWQGFEMAIDPRFYRITRGVNASELAGALAAGLQGMAEAEIADFSQPRQSDVGMLTYVSDAAQVDGTGPAGIVITTAELAPRMTAATAVLSVDNPRLAFARAVGLCLADDASPNAETSTQAASQIEPSAVIAPTAVIGAGVMIGANSVVGANSVIGSGVQIGDNCSISDNCTLSHCELGNGCRLQAGVVLGAAGFGFEITGDKPVMIPHIGILRLGPGVCVGANSAIDRGSLGDTVIGDFVMIDNMVHIAHNCEIGERCVIAGQVGIAGSTILEAGVMIGGQAGIGDHLRIGKDAVILARSGVTKDVPAGAKMVGFPAIEAGQYWRDQAAVRQILRTRAAAGKKTPPKV